MKHANEATGRVVAEDHTHSCRGCGDGVDCTGNGEGCFDGYCDACETDRTCAVCGDVDVFGQRLCQGCGQEMVKR